MPARNMVMLLISSLAALWSSAPLAAQSLSRTKALFANPPSEYSTIPFWVWNDMLTDEMVLGTLRDLAGQKIRQVFVHPRPGLMTPYLSEEWFRLWKLALKEAERLDMKLWIYDENSYPSGFAGGLVPDAIPESRGRGLLFAESTNAPEWTESNVAIFALTPSGYENITGKVRAGEKPEAARYLTASVERARNSPWNGGKSYVDLLYPGVTEKFLSVTLDAYKREVGSEFGRRIPGSFTDEPQLRPAGGLPWTEDLPAQFERRWGYNLLDHLPSLLEPAGDWKRVRHNYYQLLLELFIERWAKPYYEYCHKNGLEFTGHYWEHEWPNALNVPDNMAMSAWQQRPGIDTLMNQYAEDAHAQFGNVRAAKEIASVAKQLGRHRTLSELYGAAGWDLRFEDMKRIGDWLEVFGVNTLNQHLSYVSIRGARKRDHPQSFSYVEPWWQAYHSSASYFARLSVALTAGRQENKILLIEPTTTVWTYNTAAKNPPELEQYGEAFQKLVIALEKAQVEFDLGSEDVLARHGDVKGESLSVGQCSYRTVVIAPFTENLNSRTLELLERFAEAGGSILSCSEPPERIDGAASSRAAALARSATWRRLDPGAVVEILSGRQANGFAVRRNPEDKGILYHHRRQLEGGELLFLVNSSIEFPSAGSVESNARGVERWDPETGRISGYPFVSTERSTRAAFELPPSGSLLLFFPNKKAAPATASGLKVDRIPPSGDFRIRRTEPNVLVLDYVDVSAGGESRNNSYFYPAAQFVFQKNGMERNPWDNAVQFKDELITKKFPPESGFEAVYRFIIEEKVPASLFLVVERPELYSITCNGRAVKRVEGGWWLDRSFGKLDIAAAARVGENEVTLKASPFTIYHELESGYVIGDFALKSVEKGFVISPESEIRLGAWDAQGYPFYGAGVSYTQTFDIGRRSGQYRVALDDWFGSVAQITVNGKPAGYIGSPPWQADVTGFVSAGMNTIEVAVIGTLKNTLGPHHGNPRLGSAWPSSFQTGPVPGPPPGHQYSTVGYGLMKPFELLQIHVSAGR